MRQAITTKYIGPTSYRGSRVKATAYAGSITLDWDDALNVDENHVNAAMALADKYGWRSKGEKYQGGSLPDGKGYCFVQTEKDGEK